jgi:glycosyltransferase involved in cell wall biosynthesis
MRQNSSRLIQGEENKKIVAFATQGEKSGDAERLRTLLSQLDVQMYGFQRGNRGKQFVGLLKFLKREKPDLVVMEGTGIAGGMALILARLLWRIHYVVSSGDAVGPFARMFHPVIGLFFSVYERVLCRMATGFIGWTPYLTGRALTFGCRRAMTAPGWAPVVRTMQDMNKARLTVRRRLGISDNTIVFGIVGSLGWNARLGYCYGAELVRAILRVSRPDVAVLVVGEGGGRRLLEEMAGNRLNQQVFCVGSVPREEVPDYLAAMDVASLPQSIDGVGNFRYTTKISEYVAARLPILSGQLPMTYDLPIDWFWRILGTTPWDDRYIQALADFMKNITFGGIARKRQRMCYRGLFQKDDQIQSTHEFIANLIGDIHARRQKS